VLSIRFVVDVVVVPRSSTLMREHRQSPPRPWCGVARLRDEQAARISVVRELVVRGGGEGGGGGGGGEARRSSMRDADAAHTHSAPCTLHG
jgi:hypothetical protein